jgi:hypothetical protein
MKPIFLFLTISTARKKQRQKQQLTNEFMILCAISSFLCCDETYNGVFRLSVCWLVCLFVCLSLCKVVERDGNRINLPLIRLIFQCHFLVVLFSESSLAYFCVCWQLANVSDAIRNIVS